MMLDPETLTVHLGSAPDGSTTLRSSVTLQGTELEGDFDIVTLRQEADLELEILIRDPTAVIRGRVRASLGIACARCLDEFQIDVDGAFVRTFTWAPLPGGDDGDGEVEAIGSRRDTVSILDGVREAIILSVPRMPLCSEGCRGLCSSCGANLNREECEHRGADRS